MKSFAKHLYSGSLADLTSQPVGFRLGVFARTSLLKYVHVTFIVFVIQCRRAFREFTVFNLFILYTLLMQYMAERGGAYLRCH